MGSRRCSVWLPTPDGGLVCRATEGDAELRDRCRVARSPAVDRRPLLRIAASRSSAPCDEATLLGRALDARELATPHAVAFIPIDQGLAALAVEIESDVAGRELELLAGIASQARLAITNAGSFATLERTFLSTVEALANALEAKDSYTSSHTRWICDMAIEVGRELGLDTRTAQAARARSPLPRHREDRYPGVDPHEARAADRRGARA